MRTTATTLLLSLIVYALLFCTAVHAQSSASLSGQVADDQGAPLPGANVALEGTPLGAATDSDGDYRISGISPGTYAVRVTFVGYRTLETEIQFSAGEDVERNFTMQESAIQGEGVTVTVGSRRSTTAADLAVPVDVFSAEDLETTGTSETALVLQQVAPSVNVPRQTIADGMDALRPFTLRGLSPDHTLVLINGKRRYRSALVNRLGSGIQKGSSTVDLNAIPSSAIGQIEVLRDGAAAQYGSDAIAGVVNIQLKDEPVPLTVGYELGGHVTDDYSNDGTSQQIRASYGLPILEDGHVNLFGEIRFRDPTNRAGPDPRSQLVRDDPATDEVEGDGDVVQDIDGDGVNEVVEKNNPVQQPNFHWGNGESDNFYLWTDAAVPVSDNVELYAFGGYSNRRSLSQGFYRRAAFDRNWTEIYENGFLPEFDIRIDDYQASGGVRAGLGPWNLDLNLQTGGNSFEYNIVNSLNVTLGPASNQTEFDAGTVGLRQSHVSLDVDRAVELGFESPLNVAAGVVARLDEYEITAGERASWVDGPVKENQIGGRSAPGAQVFPGFRPEQALDESRTNIGAYLDLESDITEQWLVNVAGRFESYSDFGETINGKLAVRYQPQEEVTLRGAVSTGFRAPHLQQRFFSKVSTTFIDNVPFEVGLFNNVSAVANALGVRALEEETSVNVSGGFALTPTNNITFTTDVFFVDIQDRIILSGNLGGEEVEQLVSEFGAQRVQVFSNAIDTRTWGLDLTAEYQTIIQETGRLRLRGAFNTSQNRVVSDVRTPAQLNQDFDESIFGREARLELTKERPENVLKLSALYEKERFSVTLGTTRYGETLVPDDTPDEDFTLSSEWVVDLEARYDVFQDYATLAVGARNLLDNYPDLTPDGENFGGIFPFSTASPFGFNGRFVYGRLTVSI